MAAREITQLPATGNRLPRGGCLSGRGDGAVQRAAIAELVLAGSGNRFGMQAMFQRVTAAHTARMAVLGLTN